MLYAWKLVSFPRMLTPLGSPSILCLKHLIWFRSAFFKDCQKNSNVLFSTDLYKKISTKQKERQNRGQGPVHRIQGGKTRRPEDWKLFLSNSSNKLRLGKILKETWESDECAPYFHARTVTIIYEDEPERSKAFQLSSRDWKKTDWRPHWPHINPGENRYKDYPLCSVF